MAAAESEMASAPSSLAVENKKRKLKQQGRGKNKKKKPNKKLKPVAKTKSPSQRMKKLYKKRAREYNSDAEEEEEEIAGQYDEDEEEIEGEGEEEDRSSGEDNDDEDEQDEEEGRPRGRKEITKFAVGCRAFRTVFINIMKKHLPNDPLGPILSAHKKLVAEKLLEEETEHKAKGAAKKEKQLKAEKGHVKPATAVDSKEKLLITIATKGVVKLFNAVNKAQNPQKGLNPSRSKDAKELTKQRKQTFLSELKKSTTDTLDHPSFFSSSKQKDV